MQNISKLCSVVFSLAAVKQMYHISVFFTNKMVGLEERLANFAQVLRKYVYNRLHILAVFFCFCIRDI